jgi:hypothetical protein
MECEATRCPNSSHGIVSSVIKDADSRFGGLLFFYDSDGTRYLSSISAPTISPFLGKESRT